MTISQSGLTLPTRTETPGRFVVTDRGVRLLLDEAPRWNDFHSRYYANGRRWIKSKQRWSSSVLLHSFRSYTETDASGQP